MKPSFRLAFLLAALSACATAPATKPDTQPAPAVATPATPAKPTSPPARTPPPSAAPADTGSPDSAPIVTEAPKNWQFLDGTQGRIVGTGAERAYEELLAGKKPRRSVVVAVIDGGVDTAHADLRGSLWTNPGEVAGNGKDDDKNGYVDDVRGWNFIGGADGRDVHHDTYEVTRLHAACLTGADTLDAQEKSLCGEVDAEFTKMRQEAQQTLQQIHQIDAIMQQIVPALRTGTGADSLTVERVTAFDPVSQDMRQAKQMYLRLAANGITPAVVAEALDSYQSRLQYGLNPDYDPRDIVGDHYANRSERRYGNNDVTGPDATHGTHVAGIIAATRGNDVGIDGLSPNTQIMIVRAVPDGDERDKDVANAIRYAVDNGASIINMSFGKGYSPGKPAVDSAVAYADAHGVLFIHAAGNDGENLAVESNFPTRRYDGGEEARNWIEVGASSWHGLDSLAAIFSNYGREQVDLFAPGVDIYSSVPGNRYERLSGTSMAAPVVTGVAAMLMEYFPSLTTADVRKILIESVTPYGDRMVIQPGSDGEKVLFASLSKTGGVVNAYAAVKMAEEMTRTTP